MLELTGRRSGMATRAVLLPLCLLAASCGDAPTDPDQGHSRLTITSVSPPAGTTLTVPPQYPYNAIGGVVLPPQSGVISVSVTVEVAREVDWAQLYVYLMSDSGESGYCGQNLPDAPTWGSLPAGWTTSFTVTGFQILVPCDVTGIRAMLHTRNSGLLTPPTPAETIAEATLPTTFRVER